MEFARGKIITSNKKEESPTKTFERKIGELTIRKEIKYTSSPFLEFAKSVINGVPPNVDFEGSIAAGIGLIGGSVEITNSPSTGTTTINLSVTIFGIGFGANIVLDNDGKIISNDVFGGGQIILGAGGKIHGVALALKGTAKAGLFVDEKGISIGTDFNINIGFILGEFNYDEEFKYQIYEFDDEGGCFAAGTPILMADGTEKPIEEVKVGDWVMSFDGDVVGGPLIPGQVSQTHAGGPGPMINFHGLLVTPGHVFQTGEGGFERLDDIIRRNGTVVSADGTLIRARTNRPVTDEWFRLPSGGAVKLTQEQYIKYFTDPSYAPPVQGNRKMRRKQKALARGQHKRPVFTESKGRICSIVTQPPGDKPARVIYYLKSENAERS